MPWFLYLTMQGNLTKEWITRERGCQGTWKVSDTQKGETELAKGLCNR